MILHCNYEELTALAAGGRALLEEDRATSSHVSVSAASRVRVEVLLPRLVGDLVFDTLADVREVAAAVDAIVTHLRAEMEAAVLATHAADESAVAAYFDFAHALTVSRRLEEMAVEMEALIELVTGQAADQTAALAFRFPD